MFCQLALAITILAGPGPTALDRALLDAVGQRDLKLIKSLVAKGANLDAEFKDHAEQMEEPICDPGMLLTPLISASRSGDADVVRTLLALGAKPNHKGPHGETALLWAIADEHPDIVRILLAKGAKPSESAYKGVPILTIAAGSFSTSAVDTMGRLLEKGANVNAQDAAGKTALMAAVDDLTPERGNFLIRKKAGLNTRDRRGRTALMYATMLGSKQTVAALLAAKADVNLRDNDGWTALKFANDALAHGGPREGGMIYDGGLEGRKDFPDAMDRAAKDQYGGIVKMLKKHGAATH